MSFPTTPNISSFSPSPSKQSSLKSSTITILGSPKQLFENQSSSFLTKKSLSSSSNQNLSKSIPKIPYINKNNHNQPINKFQYLLDKSMIIKFQIRNFCIQSRQPRKNHIIKQEQINYEKKNIQEDSVYEELEIEIRILSQPRLKVKQQNNAFQNSVANVSTKKPSNSSIFYKRTLTSTDFQNQQSQQILKLKSFLNKPSFIFSYLKQKPQSRIISFCPFQKKLKIMVFKCLEINKQYIQIDVPSFQLSREEILENKVKQLEYEKILLNDELLAKDFQIEKCKEELYFAQLKIKDLEKGLKEYAMSKQERCFENKIQDDDFSGFNNVRSAKSQEQNKKKPVNNTKLPSSIAGSINSAENESQNKTFTNNNHQNSILYTSQIHQSQKKPQTRLLLKTQQLQKKLKPQQQLMSLSAEMIIPNKNQNQQSFLSHQEHLLMSNLSNGKSLSSSSSPFPDQQKKQKINHLSHLKRYLQKFSLPLLQDLITKKILQGTKSLILQNLKIKQIPPFPDLIKLQTLALDKNQIQKLQNLWQLQNLQTLHISSNKINKIQGLQHLHKLKTLNLGSNKITKIENIARLRNLQKLFLQYNQITVVTEQLYQFKNLKLFKIRNNKIDWDDSQSGEKSIKILKKLEANDVVVEVKI